MADALSGLFQTFINYLFESGDISVPTDYHSRCVKIKDMLDNDISGTINTLLDYSINSASETRYRVECSEPTLQKLLNLWLDKVNIDIKGIPTGLQALSKEYFKERWSGSSFCVLRVQDWEKISADKVEILVPTTMWFVNGGSIYIVRPKTENYKLGSDKLYLDKSEKIEIPSNAKEDIIIQKPYDRWFDKYPTPYLIRKGIYKNWLGMKTLQDKSDEVISKVLPYLFLMSKGSVELLKDDVTYSDEELGEFADNFKVELEKYKNQKGKLPAYATSFDSKFEHLIPDLSKVLKEELYRQGYRSILAGMGFIDMLEISPSRQETRMNPKAFISEINEGINGFKQILLEIISLIELKNKTKHPKLFTEKGELIIVNSPLRINVEQMFDALRSGYDRGAMSIRTYQEILGIDPVKELAIRKKEIADGTEEVMYPHVITNQEDKGQDLVKPVKPRNLEDQDKKKRTPETNTKTAGEEEFEIAPYKDLEDLLSKHSELKKYPETAQKLFMEVWNSIYKETGDEARAFSGAWSQLKKWMKRHQNKEQK
jgi:hypothetical protein